MVMPNRRRAHFVVGTGRCGSTLLSNLLDLHPEVLSISEFFSVLSGGADLSTLTASGSEFWERLNRIDEDLAAVLKIARVPEVLVEPTESENATLAPLRLVTLPQWRVETKPLLEEMHCEVGRYPLRGGAEHLDDLFDWFRKRFQRQVWVERSGGSLEYADRLSRGWPSAKFVVLLRDGRECAYSMSRHPLFRVRVARFLSPESDVATCLQSDIAIDRFAAYWSALMVRTQRWIATLERTQWIAIRFDQLLADPHEVLTRLAMFLDVPPREDWIRSATETIRSARARPASPTTAERAAIERLCRPGMRAYAEIVCNRETSTQSAQP
ncbi:MAG TPA: sulfotransferase [Polyangiales bacterium]|nr:sulfotransferase [Polyangiales bacterium]